jgi:hypothetical protein
MPEIMAEESSKWPQGVEFKLVVDPLVNLTNVPRREIWKKNIKSIDNAISRINEGICRRAICRGRQSQLYGLGPRRSVLMDLWRYGATASRRTSMSHTGLAAVTSHHGLDIEHPNCRSSFVGVRPTTLGGNPQAVPRPQSHPQHDGDCDHFRSACSAVGAGLGSAAFRILVAFPAACSAGCGLSRAAIHDSARLRSRLLFPPSHGE